MRFRNFVAVTAAIACVGVTAQLTPAQADPTTPTYIGMTSQDVGVMDRARPEYDAKGIPMGGFRLFPTLDTSASYDDNVYRLPASQSDYYFEVAPSARLQSQWGRHFVELYGGTNSYIYSKNSRLNLTDWNVGSDGRLDISRAAVASANVNYSELHEALSSPNVTGFQAEPNRYYKTHADVKAAYQPNRLGLGAGVSFDHYNWQNTPAVGGGTLFNSDRNESEYQAYAKIFYAFSPGYSGFVKASYDSREFAHRFDRSGADRSSHGYRIDGGLDLQITHLVSGEIFAGYLKQNFAQNVPVPLPNVSGIDFGAQLDWYASQVLTLHLQAARTVSDVIIAGASVSDDRSVKVSADYELRRNVIVQAYGAYTNSNLVGTTRTDNYPSAGIAVKYMMNRYMSTDLQYNYSKRSSSAPGINFTDNTVSLGLTLHI